MSDPFNYVEFVLFLNVTSLGPKLKASKTHENDPNLCSAGFLLRLLLLLLIPRTEQELTCGQLVEAAAPSWTLWMGVSQRVLDHDDIFTIVLMLSIYSSI